MRRGVGSVIQLYDGKVNGNNILFITLFTWEILKHGEGGGVLVISKYLFGGRRDNTSKWVKLKA